MSLYTTYFRIFLCLILLFFSGIYTAKNGYALPLEEIWLSGSVRQNATQKSEWEAATGFGKNQILYERELTPDGMKSGWGYDINVEKKKKWTRTAFTDLYRQTQKISLQASSFTVGRDMRFGFAMTGTGWEKWGLMGVCEIDYTEGWIAVQTQYMTDLSNYRWSVNGGLEVPLSERITFGPTLNYSGTESLTVGKGKVKVSYRF